MERMPSVQSFHFRALYSKGNSARLIAELYQPRNLLATYRKK